MDSVQKYKYESKFNTLLYHLVKHDRFLKSFTLNNTSNYVYETKAIKKLKKPKQKQVIYDPSKSSFEYDFYFNLNFSSIFTEGIDIHIGSEFNQLTSNTFKGYGIGILGQFNKGKTFILSKLFNLCEDYQKQSIEHTPDIAIKLLPNNETFIVDTMGTGIALDKEQLDETSNNLYKMKELFNRKCIHSLCDMIIYVMGELEQNDIEQYQIIKRINKKQIIIIHNLQYRETLTEINTYVKDVLQKTFNISEIVRQDCVYYSEKDNKDFLHFILGKWNSPDPELREMNELTCSFIQKKIDINFNPSPLNILQYITETLQSFIKKFFSIKEKEMNVDKVVKIDKVDIEVEVDVDNEKIIIDKQQKYVYTPNEIKGNFVITDSAYICNNFRVYQLTKEMKEVLFVEIDVLGGIDESSIKEETREKEKGNYIVKCEGKFVKRDRDENLYIVNKCNYQRFIAEVKFNFDKDKIIKNHKKFEFKNGIIKLEYDIEGRPDFDVAD